MLEPPVRQTGNPAVSRFRRAALAAALGVAWSAPFLALPVFAAEEPAKSSAAEPAKADIDLLQGSWRIAELEISGQKNSPTGDDARIEFSKDRLKSGKGAELFVVKLESGTNPKLIDFERIEGSEATQSLEGIYKLEGDKLTICVSIGEGVRVRPTEFTGKQDSGCALVVLERIKP